MRMVGTHQRTFFHMGGAMDCWRSRKDVVQIDIYCISCRERIFGLSWYCILPIPDESWQWSYIQSSVVYVSLPLGIYFRWWRQLQRLMGITWDDLDLGQRLTLGTTAKCRVDCTARIAVYCTLGNEKLYLNNIRTAAIPVRDIFWVKRYTFAFSLFCSEPKCELLFFQDTGS